MQLLPKFPWGKAHYPVSELLSCPLLQGRTQQPLDPRPEGVITLVTLGADLAPCPRGNSSLKAKPLLLFRLAP